MTLASRPSNSVILADRSAVISEGIRSLLETEFDNVYVVANSQSLNEGAERLLPGFIVLEPSIGPEPLPELLRDLRQRSPASRVIALASDAGRSVANAMLAAGADAVVAQGSEAGAHRGTFAADFDAARNWSNAATKR